MRRAALAVPLLFILAGCGGDGDGGTAAPPSVSTPKPAASTPAPAASSGAATVDIQGFTFKPGEITVAPGDKVTFLNEDAANHNVVFETNTQSGIPNLRDGQKGTVTFSDAGSFTYVCSYHPGMEGTVVVK